MCVNSWRFKSRLIFCNTQKIAANKLKLELRRSLFCHLCNEYIPSEWLLRENFNSMKKFTEYEIRLEEIHGERSVNFAIFQPPLFFYTECRKPYECFSEFLSKIQNLTVTEIQIQQRVDQYMLGSDDLNQFYNTANQKFGLNSQVKNDYIHFLNYYCNDNENEEETNNDSAISSINHESEEEAINNNDNESNENNMAEEATASTSSSSSQNIITLDSDDDDDSLPNLLKEFIRQQRRVKRLHNNRKFSRMKKIQQNMYAVLRLQKLLVEEFASF